MQKAVNWEQSKRLRTGTLVALTPARDGFRSKACIAIVAARPLAALQADPPSIDLFFTSPDSLEIDPQQEWIMVESRNGFFEGHRHVLRGLQMLADEPFPLNEHIVDLDRCVDHPSYIKDTPYLDLSTIFPQLGESIKNFDITKAFPRGKSTMDSTQLEALHRILSKRLSIVQGEYLSHKIKLISLQKIPDS